MPAWLERLNSQFPLRYAAWLLSALGALLSLVTWVGFGVGGWFAVQHRIDVGTIVAVVSGLGKLKDPWSDLVNWARELSVDSVKYRLFADAVGRRGLATA